MARRRRRGGTFWGWCADNCPSDEDGRIIEPRAANPNQFPEQEKIEPSEEEKIMADFINSGEWEKLPVRQKRAFRLIVLEKLTYRQAASRMAISQTAVHKRMKSAARTIKKMLEDRI